MYGKEEAQHLRKLFWTSFGKYMGKHKSAEGKNIKWLNYKSHVKDIFIRMDADKKTASVQIDLQHRDSGIRKLFYNQFEEVKTAFKDMVGEDWIWDKKMYDDYGKEISRIGITLEGVNMYNKDHWNEIFHFFEKHMVAVDEFWTEFKELFKQLEE